MPPKVKKPRAKPKPKTAPKPKAKPKPRAKPAPKAVAPSTTIAQGQAQATNVVVQVGNIGRRRATAKPKPKATEDGWLPAYNLSRSGSVFAPPTYNIPYINPSTYASAPPSQPSKQNLFAGRSPPPSGFVERAGATFAEPISGAMDTAFAPDEDALISKSIIDAERTLANVPKTPSMRPDWTDIATPFIRPTISGKPFVEATASEPTFASASGFPQPVFEPEPEPEPVKATPKKQAPLRDSIRKNITDIINELGYSRDNAFKQKVAKDALGFDYIPNKKITGYTKIKDTERILALLLTYPRPRKGEGEAQYEYVTSKTK